ncbi:MAG: RsfS/YbeB/iojap family protein [Spirochaetia bacterium]|nr:RsfS/YbeB/iojap family protein [Spirochaetia bacterium]
MVDTVKSRDAAIEVGRMIDEHKGSDTVVIDVHEQSSWTSYFVISTINSVGHLKGLTRQLKKFAQRARCKCTASTQTHSRRWMGTD